MGCSDVDIDAKDGLKGVAEEDALRKLLDSDEDEKKDNKVGQGQLGDDKKKKKDKKKRKEKKPRKEEYG